MGAQGVTGLTRKVCTSYEKYLLSKVGNGGGSTKAFDWGANI